MNKLTLVTLISSALSAGAMAGDNRDKITSSFDELDKNSDGYISRDEARDNDITEHFEMINRDGNETVSAWEFNKHVASNPSHFSGEIVAAVKARDNDIDDVDSKTMSSAGKADVEKSSSMTVKAENGEKKIRKDVEYEKDVDYEGSDADVLAMDKDADYEKGADYEQESSMTVKTEQDNMGSEKNVVIEKDVEVDVDGEAAAIAATEFDEIDTDADGKLTKAEIATAAEKVEFHEIDINNDEQVSRAEFDSYKRIHVQSDEEEYNEE